MTASRQFRKKLACYIAACIALPFRRPNRPIRSTEPDIFPRFHAMLQPTLNDLRRLIHHRAIDVKVYAREDGLFEVEARLTDQKTHAVSLAGVPRLAGEPIHDMGLHLIVDAQLDIREASSYTQWMPYPDACGAHDSAYTKLVGLNLLKGFRLGVKTALAGTKGCTHLTELCQSLPTAVIQAFAGTVINTHEGAGDGQPPFQLDRCHALRSDGPMVQLHYPRWYRAGVALPAMPPS